MPQHKSTSDLPQGVWSLKHHPSDETVPMNFLHVKSSLMSHCFWYLRNRETPRDQFCHYARLATKILVPYAVSPLSFREENVMTPMNAQARVLYNRSRIVLVSVLRAGQLMVEEFDKMLPGMCSIAHIRVERVLPDHHAEFRFESIPRIGNDDLVIVPDPMLASGGSLKLTLEHLIERGATPANITSVHLVSAPPGVIAVNRSFPDVRVMIAAMDARLDENLYICGEGLTPYYGEEGLGDFGDRAFFDDTATP